MVRHALQRGYEVVGVCRERSVSKLGPFSGRITIVPGDTKNRKVIKRAVAGCDGALVVLVLLGGVPVLVRNSSGCARLRTSRCAPCILLRLAYYTGQPGCAFTKIHSAG